MKMIVDLMYESGIHFMNHSISNTAEYGEYYAGPKVINDESRRAMKEILARIQDGSFARDFMDDCANGHAWLLEQRAEDQRARDREDRREHPLHVQPGQGVGAQAACAKAGSRRPPASMGGGRAVRGAPGFAPEEAARPRALAAGSRCAVRGGPGFAPCRRGCHISAGF